jgi:hypothetical protein
MHARIDPIDLLAEISESLGGKRRGHDQCVSGNGRICGEAIFLLSRRCLGKEGPGLGTSAPFSRNAMREKVACEA